MKIFISYSSRNREAVKHLAQDFEDMGHNIWFDQQLSGGQDWWDDILVNLRSADLLVIALTPEWLKSDPCARELSYATALNKRLLPVMLSYNITISLLPESIQRLQLVDYRQPGPESIKKMIRALNNLPAPLPPPDPLPTPPAAPISLLAEIAAELKATPLSFDAQLSILYRLKGLANDPSEAEGARELLVALKRHPDALARIADEVNEILTNTPPPIFSAPPPPSQQQPPPPQADSSQAHKRKPSTAPLPPPPKSNVPSVNLVGHTDAVRQVVFSPNGRLLASAANDKTIILWDVPNRKIINTLSVHQKGVTSIAFSPDGTLMASGSYDKPILIWSVTQQQVIASLPGHRDHTTALAFSPDGRAIASAGGPLDQMIKLWEVNSGRELLKLQVIKPTAGKIAAGVVAGIATAGYAAAAIPFAIQGTYVRTLAFSPDGRALATMSGNNNVRLWDLMGQVEFANIPGNALAIGMSNNYQILFSRTGQFVAFTAENKTLKLWYFVQRQLLPPLLELAQVNAIAFSPDERLLATGCDDQAVKIWDLGEKKLKTTLGNHTAAVNSVAWSPDGSLIASGSQDRTVMLWEVGG